MGLVKMLFIVTNVIFWAIGGTMLGVGIWLAVDPNAFDTLNIVGSAGMNDTLYSTAVYMMIGIGAGVFLIGFLGCFGGMKADSSGKNIPLKLYFVLVKLIIIAEVTTIILVAIFWGSINDSIRDQMTTDVQKLYVNETSQDGYSASWNKMQTKWTCCGSNNYQDYASSDYEKNYQELVPWTCCVMKTDNWNSINDVQNVTACRIEAARTNVDQAFDFLYPSGCYYALRNFLDQNSAIIIGVTCGFIGLQLVGSVFACLMMK